ncbi:xanthine dehydrogenase family protein molybdopterin-binding subunit [Clostridium sp. Cult1]|uniref:xanthine dehydrogenase family protein molybdopterin-binding subunit n=1 Tax=Clostridium sp. Cult1 TaxID=2079002 RepID=UPI002351AA86|nr:molybdopterin cofactor-binding domain-containing protein [Clostridium sp. Cult1]MCF6463076.1 nicotinate dehydrogenase medium molybdopterin subunit [Clostridium sp. Cult1]
MKKRGRGIGLSFYGTGYGNGFPDVSKAKVKLLKDGKVGIYVGGTEVGQGAKTVLSQIGSETLKLPLEKIILITEDTSLMPDSGTAAASRQTYNTGNAIKVACKNFKDKLKEVAKDELKLNAIHGLTVEKGEIYLEFFPQKRISFKELSKIYGDDNIEAEGEFIAQTVEMDPETGQGAPYWPYTFNACGVELEVDTITGLVEIERAVFAQDVGRAINPHLVEGQMDGGFAMALGYVLFEDLKLEKGKIYNNKFSKYLIPTAMDMIQVENIIVEEPEYTAPFGAKGIGEPVMIPVGPAILNAIYDAIGVRITELPITPERLIKAIEEDRKKKEEI